jgi:hypothetical protein
MTPRYRGNIRQYMKKLCFSLVRAVSNPEFDQPDERETILQRVRACYEDLYFFSHDVVMPPETLTTECYQERVILI